MTIRDRIIAAMTWGQLDRVPLTVYEWILPRGARERRLRDMGVGLMTRLPPHRVTHRKLETEAIGGVLQEYGAPA